MVPCVRGARSPLQSCSPTLAPRSVRAHSLHDHARGANPSPAFIITSSHPLQKNRATGRPVGRTRSISSASQLTWDRSFDRSWSSSTKLHKSSRQTLHFRVPFRLDRCGPLLPTTSIQHVQPLDECGKRHRRIDISLWHMGAEPFCDQQHADR